MVIVFDINEMYNALDDVFDKKNKLREIKSFLDNKLFHDLHIPGDEFFTYRPGTCLEAHARLQYLDNNCFNGEWLSRLYYHVMPEYLGKLSSIHSSYPDIDPHHHIYIFTKITTSHYYVLLKEVS